MRSRERIQGLKKIILGKLKNGYPERLSQIQDSLGGIFSEITSDPALTALEKNFYTEITTFFYSLNKLLSFLDSVDFPGLEDALKEIEPILKNLNADNFQQFIRQIQSKLDSCFELCRQLSRTPSQVDLFASVGELKDDDAILKMTQNILDNTDFWSAEVRFGGGKSVSTRDNIIKKIPGGIAEMREKKHTLPDLIATAHNANRQTNLITCGLFAPMGRSNTTKKFYRLIASLDSKRDAIAFKLNLDEIIMHAVVRKGNMSSSMRK